MQIVDLRQLSSWQLEPLLAEEAQQWREELRWDYRASTELIKKFVDARSLTGSAILENGRPVGYAFYVLEDHKGLVGGLFVSPRYSQQELSQRLLTDTLTTLSGIPKLERVEAQLIPFGYQLDPVLDRVRIPAVHEAVHDRAAGSVTRERRSTFFRDSFARGPARG